MAVMQALDRTKQCHGERFAWMESRSRFTRMLPLLFLLLSRKRLPRVSHQDRRTHHSPPTQHNTTQQHLAMDPTGLSQAPLQHYSMKAIDHSLDTDHCIVHHITQWIMDQPQYRSFLVFQLSSAGTVLLPSHQRSFTPSSVPLVVWASLLHGPFLLPPVPSRHVNGFCPF
jgi:hypothetical protein